MPRYFARELPSDWQIARRSSRYWLQQRTGDGIWRDVAGPYRNYHSAVERHQRLTRRNSDTEMEATPDQQE